MTVVEVLKVQFHLELGVHQLPTGLRRSKIANAKNICRTCPGILQLHADNH